MAAASSNHRTVEFYLSSLWSWLPEGSKRILEALESCDLQQANFVWDEKCDWFHIRCLEQDKEYIMNEYLKAQSEMENELKEKDVMQDDGNPIPNVENDLIGTLQSRGATSDESDESQAADSKEHVEKRRYPKGQGFDGRAAQRQVPKESKDYRY